MRRHPGADHGLRLRVLDLDPVRRSAGPVATVFAPRYQPLKAHQAGVPEQVRTNLALLEVGEHDAVHPPRQHAGEVVLPQVQRQRPKVLARSQPACRRRRTAPRHCAGANAAHRNRRCRQRRAAPLRRRVRTRSSGAVTRPQRSADSDRSSHDRCGSISDALAVALDHQAVSVVFDFMKPIVPLPFSLRSEVRLTD